MNFIESLIKSGLILCATSLLLACGDFSEGDKIFIDFGEGINTSEGYAVGTIVSLSGDYAVIKTLDMKARTMKESSKSLEMGRGNVPVHLLSEYESGRKSFENRAVIESILSDLLDEDDLVRIIDKNKQVISLLEDQEFPDRDMLLTLFNTTNNTYKKMLETDDQMKRFELNGELLDEIREIIESDDKALSSFVNYTHRLEPLTGKQFDLQVNLEIRRRGGASSKNILATLQKFVGYPALFAAQYATGYKGRRNWLMKNVASYNDEVLKAYSDLDDIESSYYDLIGKHIRTPAGGPISKEKWLSELKLLWAKAIVKPDLDKIFIKARAAKFKDLNAANAAFEEAKSTLESEAKKFNVVLLSESDKEKYFIAPTKKRLKKEAEAERHRQALDAIAEKKIAWYENVLLNYKTHDGGARFFSSYSFVLTVDDYNRKTRTFTGVINYKTHNGYFAGKNRIKGWFNKKGSEAHLIIEETSSIKKVREHPIEPVNTYGFKIQDDWWNYIKGQRQIDGQSQGWAKLYVPKTATKLKDMHTVPKRHAPKQSLPDKVSTINDIDTLLAKAKRCISTNQLTSPKGDNAYRYYQRVLEIDHTNQTAKDGLVVMGDKYKAWGKAAVQRGMYDKALSYFLRARHVTPDDSEIARLEDHARALKKDLARDADQDVQYANKNKPTHILQKGLDALGGVLDSVFGAAKYEESL